MVTCVKIRRTVEAEVSGLGSRIKKARKADNRSVETLASLAGISRGYWYDIEAEVVRDTLPEETLRRIELALGKDFGVDFAKPSYDSSLPPVEAQSNKE